MSAGELIAQLDPVDYELQVLSLNGFVERFNRTVLDEFFRETFRNKFYTSVEELQQDLDQWLYHYNHERPHRGYRNMGKRPIETIEEGKVVKEQMINKEAA